MTPTIPVTPHFVVELVWRMRGPLGLRVIPASNNDEDDCSDVELAPPYSNGAGPLMRPLLPVLP